MSKLAEIIEFQKEGYTDFPDLAEEHVGLLLAVVRAVLDHKDARGSDGDIVRQIAEMRECTVPYWDRIADKLEALK